MPATIQIANFADLNILEKARLSADTAAGTTTVVLSNNQNIVVGSTIFIGHKGSEIGQIVTVTSVSGATAVVSNAVSLPHFSGDPVYVLFGTKLKIYAAPNTNNLPPLDSTYSLIATVDIDPDQLETLYTHPTGSSALWYKFTYYNPTATIETSLADSTPSRSGGGYVSLADIRQEAGFANAPYISEVLIDQKRKSAQSQIDGALSGQYKTPFDTPVTDMIREITLQLATGMLQISQYTNYSTTDTNNGQTRIKWAEAQIEKIKSGQLTLVGVDGLPDDQLVSGASSGFPTDGSQPGFMFEATYIVDGERHW